MFDVCVVGSANLDLVATAQRLPRPGETVMGDSYREHAGGKGLNQAVAAARAGARTAFVGALGDDHAGELLAGVLVNEGIDTSHVRRVPEPTGRALIGVAGDGENSIIVIGGANLTVRADDLPEARVVLAQLEVPGDAVTRAFARSRASGAVTVLNPAPAVQVSADLLGMCDVVVPNESEAESLGGAAQLLAAGAKAVVVTMGARGAALHTRDGVVAIEPFVVDAIDTTAAGDSFCGALAARLAAGDELPDALRFAAAAGALCATNAGAVPSIPRLADVLRLVSA